MQIMFYLQQKILVHFNTIEILGLLHWFPGLHSARTQLAGHKTHNDFQKVKWGVAWHSKSPPILQPHLSSLNRTSLLLLRISKKASTYMNL